MPHPVWLALSIVALAALAPPAAAQLFTSMDDAGRTVVTNLRSSAGQWLAGAGTLSVAAQGSQAAAGEGQTVAKSRWPALSRRAPYAEHVRQASERHRLWPRLVEAVIAVESGFNPLAVSSKGAQGLMQLMPDTAAELEVADPFDPVQNIDGGARYLRRMLDQFGGDVTLALAAYHAGPTAVRKAGEVPRIAETREYVGRVRALLNGYGLSSAPSSLRTVRAANGSLRVTNVAGTQSSVRLLRAARGVPTLTNR